MRHCRSISCANSRAMRARRRRAGALRHDGDDRRGDEREDRQGNRRRAGCASCRPRARAIAGGDSSSTGSSVQADIDHSEVTSLPVSGATIAGSNSGAQNAAAARRRSRSAGQTMSASERAAGLARSPAR